MSLKIVLISLAFLGFSASVYEKYVLTKWYRFELGTLKLKVEADECERCFLDWTIDHTIWIKNQKNRKKGKFELYTEGPILEFGLNENGTELLINRPGFAFLIVDLVQMKEVKKSYSDEPENLEHFTIRYIIKKDRQLEKLEVARVPDMTWY